MDSSVSAAKAMQSSPHEVPDAFGVDALRGLNKKQVRRQREKYGWNRLKASKQRGAWSIFIDQFKSPIIALLALAAILAFAFQEWIEGIAVIIVIALKRDWALVFGFSLIPVVIGQVIKGAIADEI